MHLGITSFLPGNCQSMFIVILRCLPSPTLAIKFRDHLIFNAVNSSGVISSYKMYLQEVNTCSDALSEVISHKAVKYWNPSAKSEAVIKLILH